MSGKPLKDIQLTPPELIAAIHEPDAMLLVMFEQTSSKNFAKALEIAQGAFRYIVTKNSDSDSQKLTYVALFTRSREQATLAVMLLQIVRSWKSSQVMTPTQVKADPYRVLQTLECYLQSCAVKNYKAYCHAEYKDISMQAATAPLRNFATALDIAERAKELPAEKKPGFLARLMGEYQEASRISSPIYLLPCKRLSGHFQWGVLSNESRAEFTLEERLEALAVEQSCEWCPHFKKENFKR